MIILIPSYQPDRRLLELLEALGNQQVLVVDDGSGPAYAHWFIAAQRLGAGVIHHGHNCGKGRALRTGFAAIAERWPGQDVVCADSDGQHTPADIARIAERLAAGDADLVLGVRGFTGKVPWRSRLGNDLTRWIFKATTGVAIDDTQTGLRGYPAKLLDWLGRIDGDRFEYELKVLLAAAREKLRIGQVEIATVYLDENASSHFRPLRDSWLIYRPLLAFSASSFLGFLIDFTVLSILLGLGVHLVFAIVAARLVSGTVSYTVNRCWVFADGGPQPVQRTLARYLALAGLLLGSNIALMWLLTPILGSFWAKLLTESTLLVANYLTQRLVVFATERTRRARAQRSGATRKPYLSQSHSFTLTPGSSRRR